MRHDLKARGRQAAFGRLRRCVAGSVVAVALASAGCSVGPDYVRPDASVPDRYRESPPSGSGWKDARPQPADGSANLWSMFEDPTLDRLVADAAEANQTVAQADANFRAARAAVRLARSALFPTLGAQAAGGRSRGASVSAPDGAVGNSRSLLLESSWEPDLWGSVRRSIESASATATSDEANLAAVRLSVQAEVATDYLALRVNDELRDLFARSVDAYQRALQLSQSQLRAGTVSQSDVALATAQLKATQSLLTDTEATRAQYEHAIAVLVGKSPAGFAIAPAPLVAALPATPVGLPSELLERRPDVAVAERLAAAANADIGVARAAYFPVLTLSASGGASLAGIGQLFSTPARVWTLGATLAQTLFDGGARLARTDRAVAQYDAAVAQYRQTVLAGFQEVEDNLSTLRVLENEQGTDDEAVAASRDAERIALSQYRAGTTTYLSVITAQNTALGNARTAVQLRGRRFASSVTLIRAIGGGWSTALLDRPIAAAAGASTPRNP